MLGLVAATGHCRGRVPRPAEKLPCQSDAPFSPEKLGCAPQSMPTWTPRAAVLVQLQTLRQLLFVTKSVIKSAQW